MISLPTLVQRIQLDASGFHNEAGKVEGRAASIGSKMAGIGKSMTLGMTLPLIAIGTMGVKAATDVNHGLHAIEQQTGATGERLEGLEKDFRAVAGTSGASFEKIGSTIALFNIRLGTTGPTLQNLTKTFLTLQRVAGSGAPTVDSITKFLANWGISADQATPALDRLFRATQASGVPMNTLMQQLTRFGPQLRQFGFGVDESAAMLANLGKQGVIVPQAMQGLTRFFREVSSQGKDPAKAFRDTTNEVQRLIKSGNDPAARDLVLKMFGPRAGVQMFDQIKQGRLNFEQLLATIQKGPNTIASVGKATAPLSSQFSKLKNQVSLALEPIGQQILPVIVNFMSNDVIPVFQTINSVISGLSPTTMKWVVGIGAVVAAVGPLFAVGSRLVSIYSSVGSTIIKMIEWVGKLGEARSAETAATEAATAATERSVAAAEASNAIPTVQAIDDATEATERGIVATEAATEATNEGTEAATEAVAVTEATTTVTEEATVATESSTVATEGATVATNAASVAVERLSVQQTALAAAEGEVALANSLVATSAAEVTALQDALSAATEAGSMIDQEAAILAERLALARGEYAAAQTMATEATASYTAAQEAAVAAEAAATSGSGGGRMAAGMGTLAVGVGKIALVGTIIVGLTLAVDKLGDVMAGAAPSVELLQAALAGSGEGAATFQQAMDKAGLSVEKLDKSVKTWAQSSGDVIDRFVNRGAGRDISKLDDALAGLVRNGHAEQAAAGLQAIEQSMDPKTFKELRDHLDDYDKSLTSLAAGNKIDTITEDQKKAADAAEALASAQGELSAATGNATGIMQAAANATPDALKAMAKAITEYEGTVRNAVLTQGSLASAFSGQDFVGFSPDEAIKNSQAVKDAEKALADARKDQAKTRQESSLGSQAKSDQTSARQIADAQKDVAEAERKQRNSRIGTDREMQQADADLSEAREKLTRAHQDAAQRDKDANEASAKSAKENADRQSSAAERVTDAVKKVDEAKKTAQEGSVEGFMQKFLTQAQNFASNLSKAIAAGYDPKLISDIAQQGPQQAGPILEALVRNATQKNVDIINNYQKTLDEVGQKTVAMARLTNLAVSSGSDQMARDLNKAQTIQNQILQAGPSTISQIAAATKLGVDEVTRIVEEFGIGINQDFTTYLTGLGLTGDVQRHFTTEDRGQLKREFEESVNPSSTPSRPAPVPPLGVQGHAPPRVRAHGAVDVDGQLDPHIARDQQVVYGEPETGGEAFIPLAPRKRPRSKMLLDRVATAFGYKLARIGEMGGQEPDAASMERALGGRGPRAVFAEGGLRPRPNPPRDPGFLQLVANTIMTRMWDATSARMQGAMSAAGMMDVSGVPTGQVPGSVTSWLMEAIGLTGVPSTWLNGLSLIAMHESGGNPHAINTTDINAQRGDPSRGLMQTIGSTFRSNALAGHGDIWNPVDNAAAAIRYILARYRDISRVPGVASVARGGPYLPYREGGFRGPEINLPHLAEGGLAIRDSIVRVAERGRPEAILPLRDPAVRDLMGGIDEEKLGRVIGEHVRQAVANQRPLFGEYHNHTEMDVRHLGAEILWQLAD